MVDNVLFGRFYLLSRAGTSSQLTRPRKNELPLADRFTSGECSHALATDGTNCAQKSICIRDPRARINNGVNERRTRPTFFPLFHRAALAVLSAAAWNPRRVREQTERKDRSIDRSPISMRPDGSPTAD